MSNNNCLQGLACPKCGNEQRLVIEVASLASVTDAGTDVFEKLATRYNKKWNEFLNAWIAVLSGGGARMESYDVWAYPGGGRQL